MATIRIGRHVVRVGLRRVVKASITAKAQKLLEAESAVLGIPQQEILSRLIEDYEAAPSVIRRARLRLLPEGRENEIIAMELRHYRKKPKGRR